MLHKSFLVFENAKIKKNRHIEAGNVVLFSYTANRFNLHIFLEIENKTIYGILF